PGPWELGRPDRWINSGGLGFVAIVVDTLGLPFTHAAVPLDRDFGATAFNYTPLVILVGLAVAVWWQLSAKNRYKGPVRTLEEIEEELEGTPPQQPEPPAAGPTPAPVT